MNSRVRVVVLYNGPNRVMRVLAWVSVACLTITIGLPLIFGLPPTWWTVANAAFAVPIANDLIKHYRMKNYFGGEAVSSIVMSKIEAPSEAERMRN